MLALESWLKCDILSLTASSSLRIQHASLRLCSRLPASLRQPHTNLPDSNSPPTMTGTSSFINSPLLSSVIPSLFYFSLKTFRFCKFLPPLPFFFFRTDSSGSLDYYQYFWADTFLFCYFFVFHFSVQYLVPCGRLSWHMWAFERMLKWLIISYRKIFVGLRQWGWSLFGIAAFLLLFISVCPACTERMYIMWWLIIKHMMWKSIHVYSTVELWQGCSIRFMLYYLRW